MSSILPTLLAREETLGVREEAREELRRDADASIGSDDVETSSWIANVVRFVPNDNGDALINFGFRFVLYGGQNNFKSCLIQSLYLFPL